MQEQLETARDEVKAQQQQAAAQASEAKRLHAQNELLLALLGRPNSGLADAAARTAQAAVRGHAARRGNSVPPWCTQGATRRDCD